MFFTLRSVMDPCASGGDTNPLSPMPVPVKAGCDFSYGLCPVAVVIILLVTDLEETGSEGQAVACWTQVGPVEAVMGVLHPGA
jgi:hypothetical protein